MTGRTGTGVAPAQVRVVQDRFERWRKNKLGRERIPERLWSAAVKLCERHALDRVRRWLRLNYTALRDRAGSARRSGSTPQKKKSVPAFVEWVSTAPTSASSGAEYVLEVVDARGPDVRLRVRGTTVAQVAELARLLRRQEP